MTQGSHYMYSIKGLLIPKVASHDKVINDINTYVANIPMLAESLTECLCNSEYSLFVYYLETVRTMLFNVYARWLTTDADTLLNAAKSGDWNVCKRMLPGFKSNLLSLSIGMQMAQTVSVTRVEAKPNESEIYTDIINNLNAVMELVGRQEFDGAFDLLSDMREQDSATLGEGEAGLALINALLLRDGDNAAIAAEALKAEYIAKIEQCGGTWNGEPAKILAVDDRPDVLSTVSRLLKDRYKLFYAPNAEAALKLLSLQKPDLFIFDIEMPGMNGFELARKVRAIPTHVKTPILFLTGNASRAYVVKAMEAGGNDFIVKPPNHSTLLARIGKYL